MAQYSSADVIVLVDNNAGAPQTFTAYVRAIGNISIEGIIQEATVFGASWATFVSTAIKKMAPITLGGFYDTTAVEGPDVLFAGYAGSTTTRTVKITYGGGKYTEFEALVQKYERMPKLGAMTEYQVTLQPTGTVTEA